MDRWLELARLRNLVACEEERHHGGYCRERRAREQQPRRVAIAARSASCKARPSHLGSTLAGPRPLPLPEEPAVVTDDTKVPDPRPMGQRCIRYLVAGVPPSQRADEPAPAQ